VSKQNDFSDLAFHELIDFVSTIKRTKKKSSTDVWREGYGLQAMEHLETEVEHILQELTDRVKTNWSYSIIQKNFKRTDIALPSDILNIFNMTSSELNKKLYKYPPAIGSEIIDGYDEIWFILGNWKYQMSKNGHIKKEKISD